MSLLPGLRLALTTLTVAPVRPPASRDRRTAGTAMALAPVVGLGLGVLAAAALFLVRNTAAIYSASMVLPAVVAVALLAVLTRGLHLDGLADTVDGLASYLPAERARAVMKSPEVGALGVVAIGVVLLLQVTALATAVDAGRGTIALVLAAVAGRLAVTLACTPGVPPAPGSGLGAQVLGTVSRRVAYTAVALVAVAAVAYESQDEAGAATTTGALLVECVRPLLALALGLTAAWALRRHAVRRLGGVNGDVLGALVEVTTTVVLVAMTLNLPVAVQRATGWWQPH